jgi:trk system potassium uptake protein TrkH
VRIDSQVIDNSTKIKLLAFVFLYFTIILVATVVLMLCGTDFMESESIAITSLCNVGPGLGKCGPAYSWDTLPDATLWISSILMLIGRLEIFAVMIIFTPSFWRDH